MKKTLNNSLSMLRVDLHLHSKFSEKNGDSVEWQSYKNTLRILNKNKVSIVSITDHNFFSLKLFKEMQNFAGDQILVLPGVELDIKLERGARGQILAIFSNELSEANLVLLESTINNNAFKGGILISKFKNMFKNFDIISIPHVGKRSDNFSLADLNKIKYDAIEISSFSNPNYRKLSKWIKSSKTTVVAFSDTHRWNKYPECRKIITYVKCNKSFISLQEALKNNKIYLRKEND